MVNIRYLITQSLTAQTLDFNLNYGSVSMAGESLLLVGSGNVDSVKVYPGTTFDFTRSGLGDDRIYLTGNYADYIAASVSSTVVSLSRGSGVTSETILVSKGSASTFDTVVYADGSASKIGRAHV